MVADEIEILKQLITIPSENPGGSEVKIVEFLKFVFDTHNISYVIHAQIPSRPNIIATIGDKKAGPTLILQGHIDTKPAAHGGSEMSDWMRSPFEPEIVDDQLYGLGACDTKGGVAALLASFICLSKYSRKINGEVIFQGVADEEHGSRYGSEYLLAEGLLQADAAIVSEPTEGLPTLSQLGNCWVKIDIKGKAAHGGTPWQGIDAIEAAIELVEVMRAKVAKLPLDKRFPHHPKVRIGKIMGGGHAGTVASQCSFVTDIRVRPGETREDYMQLWISSIEEVEKQKNIGVELSLFAGGGCESHEIDSNHNFAKLIAHSWEVSTGTPWRESYFFGGSDARYFGQVGTPTIVVGPGSLDQAHSPNEFVSVSQVRQVKKFVDVVLEQFLNIELGTHE